MADKDPSFFNKCNKIEECLAALKSMTVDLMGKPSRSQINQEEVSLLTPAISEAMRFNLGEANERELRAHGSRLQHLLGKVLTLLQQRSRLCTNLEGQNTALTLQTESLKNVVAITKDLLSARNREVAHLQVDLKSLEEKVSVERERHSAMAARMVETRAAMEALKTQYEEQLHWWSEVRPRYEQRVVMVEAENKRLKGLVKRVEPEPPVDQGEGDVHSELPPGGKPL